MEIYGNSGSENIELPISVIVLTYNEEKNIGECLKSVYNWAAEIFIVDSFSTDRTLDIARKYTDKIYQNKFESYSKQRNWALDNLIFSNEWVFFLDADERPSDELKKEIREVLIEVPKDIEGFYIKRRFIFMGRWIKHGGYYPTWLLRLFRHKSGRCQDREVDEHFIVSGKTLQIQNDIIHEDKRGITFWIDRHNQYATLEAFEQTKEQSTNQNNPSANSYIEKKRLLKRHIWNCFPIFFRPFIFFFYRYILRGGFLDGKAGFIYHFLHGFWYRLLVDIKIKEMQKVQ
jgi:glycosyltransferase involved in cell wall biosynthesis